MIKVENLTKIYVTNRKKKAKALDGVTLTLPDKGMVFILGKSGSGKSTFLNLLGGLDTFDGGDIVVYGNSLKKFRRKRFEAYRSDFIGFIFQDYHLLEELTVAENITLFEAEKQDNEVLEGILRTVGLEGYGERYPDELSGGQKQRVAIARAVYKNPKIILCDEPTGNLDRNTSLQILDLLKELSKEKLVVIVSHNLDETQKYADRIIELADGKVVSDRLREENYLDELKIEEGVVTLPYRKRMQEEDLSRLNAAVGKGQVREIKINSSGFVQSEVAYEDRKEKPVLRKITRASAAKLFKRFLFSKKAQSIVAILTSMIAFGAFAVVQSFGCFDSMKALSESQGGEWTVIEKDTDTYSLGITDDFSFVQASKSYGVYDQPIWQKNSHSNSLDKGKLLTDKRNFSDLYIHENYGLFCCDSDYLAKTYGLNGEIRLLAGSLDGAEESTGVYITDYFADSILYHEAMNKTYRFREYDDLITVFNPMKANTACRIAGIIDTDYETEYKAVFDTYQEVKDDNKKEVDLQKILSGDSAYIEFMDDVVLRLGLAYTLNPNYIDGFSLEETSYVRSKNLYFSANGRELIGDELNYMTANPTPIPCSAYADDEIAIPYKYYNALFGTEYNESDCNKLDVVEKRKVTIKRYVDDDDSKPLLYEKEFTVTVLTTVRISGNENTLLYFKRGDWRPCRLYFQEVQNIEELMAFMTENGYHFVSIQQRNLQKLNDLVTTFYDLFTFLQMIIIAMLVVYLVNFGVRSVRQNSYQIGVIKALGGRNRDVENIFVLKTLLIGAIVAVASVLGSVFFIRIADSILLSSVESVVEMRFPGLTIIDVLPSLLLADGLFMLGLAVVSSLVPALTLRRIKPIQIIKAKE